MAHQAYNLITFKKLILLGSHYFNNYVLFKFGCEIVKKLRAALSLLLLASTFNDVRRKLHMVEIHSTVRKRVKRMSNSTFKTTSLKRGEASDQKNPGLYYSGLFKTVALS